ncbi:hypothetical protein [Polaribacter cellanae]|uniref:Uncharacterized protein n=1 Tax=Polaribacter cellanae TaxID=2818493 RepID=A0A975CQ50_9FLAO|nr:hypothetical protein [Polaribacter cellanae]QTE21822.1 hypothetical protein J3359_13495 [Polaribacter cellanae]
MKNRKNKITNLLKIGVLLFGISVLLWNCEEEEINNFKTPTNSKTPFETIPFKSVLEQEEFNEIAKVSKTEKYFKESFNNPKGIFSKSSSRKKSFEVIKKFVKKIKKENYTSYTFLIKRDKNIYQNSVFENLVVEKKNNKIKAFIIKYEPSLEYLHSKNLPFSGKLSVQKIDYDPSFLSKMQRECGWIETYTRRNCTVHGYNGVNIPGCNNYGKDSFVYSASYVCSDSGGGGTSFGSGGSSTGGGGGSKGGGSTTSPVYPCEDPIHGCDKMPWKQLANQLEITDQTQIDWVNDSANLLQVNALFNFGEANQWSNSVIAISQQIVSGLSNTNNLNLSFEENLAVKNKATEIFDIIAKNNFTNIDQFSLADQKTIAKNSLFIGLLPSVSSIIGNYWPKNAEQWAVIGDLFVQFLPELALGFIPGSSIVDVIKGLDKGDAVGVAFGIAGVIADVFGGTILGGLTKAVKIGKKVFTSFKLTYKFVTVVGKGLKAGLKVSLEGTTVILKKSGNEIARIANNVMTFNYSGFGGKIITNPNKTTTVIGRFDDLINPPGVKTIKDSSLYKYGENSGGINILDAPTGTWSIQLNMDWLNDAIQRGDIIRVVSNPLDNRNLFRLDSFGNITNQLTPFGMEVNRLNLAGYTFNPSTFEFIP